MCSYCFRVFQSPDETRQTSRLDMHGISNEHGFHWLITLKSIGRTLAIYSQMNSHLVEFLITISAIR